MGDLISRQQAFDALHCRFADGFEEDRWWNSTHVIATLKELPSVQPDPCEDAVSRKAALSMIDTYMNKSVELHYLPTSDGIKKLISILPSVQSERKTGRWIPVTNGRGGHQCDRCGCYAPSYQSGTEWLSNFCPECGADMRGEANGQE